jgi:hypothetical protein
MADVSLCQHGLLYKRVPPATCRQFFGNGIHSSKWASSSCIHSILVATVWFFFQVEPIYISSLKRCEPELSFSFLFFYFFWIFNWGSGDEFPAWICIMACSQLSNDSYKVQALRFTIQGGPTSHMVLNHQEICTKNQLDVFAFSVVLSAKVWPPRNRHPECAAEKFSPRKMTPFLLFQRFQ